MDLKKKRGNICSPVGALCLLLVCAMMLAPMTVFAQTRAAFYAASVGQVQYATVSEAVAAAKGQTVKLLADSRENVNVTGDLYLDLNGYILTGLTVTDGTLYGMDSTTDDYDCVDGYGEIRSFAGSYETVTAVGSGTALKRYLTVNDQGMLSFHRVYVGITHSSLKPANTAVGYQAVFAADQAVTARLHRTEAFGYELQLDQYPPVQRWKSAGEFVSEKTVSLRVQNYDSQNYGEAPLAAWVQLKLSDGTTVTSSGTVNTLREMIETVNDTVTDFSREQLDALAVWSRSCDTMMTWRVENILNPPTQTYTVKFINYNGKLLETQTVNAGEDAQLPANPTKSGATFLGWSGNYANVQQDGYVRAVFSDEKNVIIARSATAKPGGTVAVLFEITGQVKTCCFDFDFFYDPNLQIVSYDDDLDLDIIFNKTAFENGCSLNFTAATDRTKQRDILEVTFRVSQEAEGMLPITLVMNSIKELNSKNTYSDTGYVLVNGCITVN